MISLQGIAGVGVVEDRFLRSGAALANPVKSLNLFFLKLLS